MLLIMEFAKPHYILLTFGLFFNMARFKKLGDNMMMKLLKGQSMNMKML